MLNLSSTAVQPYDQQLCVFPAERGRLSQSEVDLNTDLFEGGCSHKQYAPISISVSVSLSSSLSLSRLETLHVALQVLRPKFHGSNQKWCSLRNSEFLDGQRRGKLRCFLRLFCVWGAAQDPVGSTGYVRASPIGHVIVDWRWGLFPEPMSNSDSTWFAHASNPWVEEQGINHQRRAKSKPWTLRSTFWVYLQVVPLTSSYQSRPAFQEGVYVPLSSALVDHFLSWLK